MQKKLIALAIAGLVSAPVFAQSSVSIYGVADAYMGLGSHADNDFAGVESGGLFGSRLGFRGAEDLGRGLKAVFTLEQGFGIDDGSQSDSSMAFQRQAFVGLAGAFGAVTLGRQYAPGWDFQYDVMMGSIVSPQYLLSSGVNSSIAASSDARWNNSVAYNGMFSGLKVRAIYSMAANENSTEYPGNDWTDPSDDDAAGLGLEYSNGPLKVGAVYQYLQGAASGTKDQREWLVGGSYDFGVLTLAMSYQDAQSLHNTKDQDGDLWQLGVTVPVGAAGKVHVAYGEMDIDNAYGNNKDGKVKSYALAYTYALSKRTTAYTGYNRTDNDKGMVFGPVQYKDKDGLGTYGGDNSDLFVVGVAHTF